MPRQADGTYTRDNSVFQGRKTWNQQANSGDPTIRSDRHDYHDNDVGDALTDSLSRSGSGGMQADLAMGGKKIVNLAPGTADTDAPTKLQAETFTPDTSGTEPRPINDVFNEILRLRDFPGIDPTGDTASDTGLANAIATGRSIDFGDAIIRVDNSISADQLNQEFYGRGIHTTTDTKKGTWIRKSTNDGQPVFKVNAQGVKWHNMMIGHDPSITLSTLNDGCDGIQVADLTAPIGFCELHNVELRWNRRGLTTNDSATNISGIFSWLLHNVKIRKCSGRFLSLRGINQGQTGSVFNNLYIANGEGDGETVNEDPISLSSMVDSVFNQLNVEWINHTGDRAVLLESVQGLTFNGWHFEGIAYKGSNQNEACLIQSQNRTKFFTSGLRMVSTDVPGTIGRYSMFKLQSSTTADQPEIDVRNMTIDKTTALLPTNFHLVRATSGNISQSNGAFVDVHGLRTSKDFTSLINDAGNEDRRRSLRAVDYIFNDGATRKRFYYEPNFWVINFTDGATAPSVRLGKNFRTQNTTATTITNLTEGTEGQEISVIFKDANTTVQFSNTSLHGNGGTDWTPAINSNMRCVRENGAWHCVIGNG